MIILPDRNIPRSRLLMAVPRREWMPPSRAQAKTFCGDEDRTRFRLRARTHDGHIVWVGWLEDRDDADAFLFALANGSLRYERALWRLPTPEWHPGIGTDLVYDFLTQTILTTTGSNQTYTSPSDWNNSSNQIECLGGGGSGAIIGTSDHATGGGAGAYSLISNFSFATPGTTTATYRVGAGATGSTGSAANGVAGGVTWWNDTVDPGTGTTNAKCSAKNGSGGVWSDGSTNGGAGGATTGWGETKYAGGRGGNLTGASGRGGSGGGGAAGPSGAGGNGVDSSSTSTTLSTNGGTANNGTTAGGVAPSGAGSAGTEFSASYGCGSGGAGIGTGGAGSAGNGGNYGAGGGGCASNSSPRAAGSGRQGLIVVEYTPPSTAGFANMPMLGM